MSERESGASRKHEIDSSQSVLDQSKMEEKQSHAKDQNANTAEIKSWKDMVKEMNNYQLKISLPRRLKTPNKFHLLPQKAASEATYCEATLSMQDQICKAPCGP